MEYTKILLKVEKGIKKGYSSKEVMNTPAHTTLLDILTRPVTGDLDIQENSEN